MVDLFACTRGRAAVTRTSVQLRTTTFGEVQSMTAQLRL